jgi:hypothetical protein
MACCRNGQRAGHATLPAYNPHLFRQPLCFSVADLLVPFVNARA